MYGTFKHLVLDHKCSLENSVESQQQRKGMTEEFNLHCENIQISLNRVRGEVVKKGHISITNVKTIRFDLACTISLALNNHFCKHRHRKVSEKFRTVRV